MKGVVGLYDPKTGWFKIVSMNYTQKIKRVTQKSEELVKIKIRDKEFEVLGTKLPNGKILIDPLPTSLVEYYLESSSHEGSKD